MISLPDGIINFLKDFDETVGILQKNGNELGYQPYQMRLVPLDCLYFKRKLILQSGIDIPMENHARQHKSMHTR